MAKHSFQNYVRAANAPLTDPDKNRTVGSGKPRFELYHFALSVCSQKVRTCLAEKGAPYIAHDINIQPGNYHVDYVRLRLLARNGRALVGGGYTGRSSTATEGFDPAVVPTLVDHETQTVHADSVHICAHIDSVVASAPSLIPASLKSAIMAEIAVVDGTPHVAVLYGAHPDGDFRPQKIRQGMAGIHDRKIAKLSNARSQVLDDAQLVAAFDAKIAKESAAKTFVATADMMRDAVREINRIIASLEARIRDGRAWVCGDAFTMADIMWAVSLFRLKWLGMGFCWQGAHALNKTSRPQVAAYAKRLFDRPSFRDAVIHWPGIPQSEFVSEYYSD